MKTKPNDQAYPYRATPGEPNPPARGLTKRERFAMEAMQGLLAATYTATWDWPSVAEHSVKCADALIAELNKM